ncbi:MAG TPA: AraC family transcriptional regulator [Bacteroidia bacterium]|nr:AraC family transcriptional regulator [Bacteroidia bacterium]HNP97755.1 AraC family transcriptional regulator [Bacteroidia bacterium]
MNEYPKFYLFRRIVQAKLFIDEQFAGKIDLDQIADEAFFSKFHFTRLFKTVYGITPHQYLTGVRVEHAKLLLQTDIAIADVCYQVGFESTASFTTLFKKSVGTTPAAFRDHYRIRQEEISRTPLNFIPNCFAESKGWTKISNFQ